jgi:hypothetical protein
MNNKIISIGWMGYKRCYLNITVDEAIKRYCESENIEITEDYTVDDLNIDIIEFDDEFGAYSVWE